MPTLLPYDDVKQTVADQIQAVMDENEWQLKDLKRETGFSVSKLSQWKNGIYAPGLPELLVLAEACHKSVDWFLGKDDINQPSQELVPEPLLKIGITKYEAERASVIESTSEELWIVNRIGNQFIPGNESRQALEYIMKNHEIYLRVILPDPGVSEDSSAIDTVAIASESTFRNKHMAAAQIGLAKAVFEQIIADSKKPKPPKESKVLQIPYAPSYVIYLSDPELDTGKLLYIPVAFQSEPLEAPFMVIEKSKAEQIFNWFHQDCLRVWDAFKSRNANKTP